MVIKGTRLSFAGLALTVLRIRALINLIISDVV
jgi:hypothetical protein